MNDIKKLLRVWPYLRPYRKEFIMSVILILLVVITSSLEPFILGLAITEISLNVADMITGVEGARINIEYVIQIMMIYLARGLINGASRYFSAFFVNEVVQKGIFDLRNDISEKMNRMPVSYFDKHPLGDILSRVTSDIESISGFLIQSLVRFTIGILQIIIAFIFIIWIKPSIALIVVVSLILTIAVVRLIMNISQPAWRQQAKALGEMTALTQENLSGFTEIKLYNQEKDSLDNFKARNEDLTRNAYTASFRSGLIMPLANFISNITYLIIAVLGGFMVLGGTLTLGNLQALIQYAIQINDPINMITQMIGMMQSAGAASSRVFALLDEPEEDLSEESLHLPDKVEGRVAFENVQFGYSPDNLLMENINFSVNPGDTVAVVGPTGAGKTTLINLLMRFYDVTSGAIKVDGVPIHQVSRSELRSHIGLVLQDAWLFKDTVANNIRFGDANATDEQILQAAKIANVDHFIRTLPRGYDEEIQPDGEGISQGQRQLLTIARAVISDPDILILDEATSSVDTRLEQLIQDAMDRVMENRTSFVIAHRLSTIRNADMILVMDQGNIVETGNHDELLEKDGLYASLYNAQFEQ